MTSSVRIRQCPGFWPALVQVVHEDCCYFGRVWDLFHDQNAGICAEIERDNHECYAQDGDW